LKMKPIMEISYGNGRITMIYKQNLFKEYEKKVLASGLLTGLAVMEFIEIEHDDCVTYNISGRKMISLSDFCTLNDALVFLKKILVILLNADEYLIDIDNINLDYERIYHDDRKNNIRLLYIPSAEKTTWQNSFIGLINDIGATCNRKDLTNYLEQLIHYLSTSHRTIEDVSNKISEFKRDAHLCGILFDR